MHELTECMCASKPTLTLIHNCQHVSASISRVCVRIRKYLCMHASLHVILYMWSLSVFASNRASTRLVIALIDAESEFFAVLTSFLWNLPPQSSTSALSPLSLFFSFFHFLQFRTLASLWCVCCNLFVVLHVSHSCATTSPNPWPHLESAEAWTWTGRRLRRSPHVKALILHSARSFVKQGRRLEMQIMCTETKRKACPVCEGRHDRKQAAVQVEELDISLQLRQHRCNSQRMTSLFKKLRKYYSTAATFVFHTSSFICSFVCFDVCLL